MSPNSLEVNGHGLNTALLRVAGPLAAFTALLIAYAATAKVPEPAAAVTHPASEGVNSAFRGSREPGLLPGSLSVIPGAVVHGAGLFMRGDRDTARRLLIAEGTGVGMMIAGGLPLMLTHASGQSLDATVALLVAGSGIFMTSWMADVYGATIGARGNAKPPSRTPSLEQFVGYAFVYDPQFDYRQFAMMRLDARRGSFRLSPESSLALGGGNQLVGLEGAFRLVGSRPQERARDGSSLDLQAGATYQRFGADGFAIFTAELVFPGRLDLRRLGPSLAGSFVSLDIGWALQSFHYASMGRTVESDMSGLLLVRFGYGVYLGGPSSPRGEVELYYDHRHDGFAGGLALDMHDPNIFGHVGLVGTAHFGDGWGARVSQEVGSASVTSVGLTYAWGGGP